VSEPAWIGGIHAVRQALEGTPERVLELLLARARGGRSYKDLERTAQRAGIKVRNAPRRVLDERLPDVNHQGVAILLSDVSYGHLEELLEGELPAVVVALDQVSDPRNLGAILRSAWAFGVGAVVIPKHRSAGLNAAAIKTATGAAEHVPVVRAGNLGRALEQLKEAGYWIYGAAGDAEATLGGIEMNRPTVVVLGAEGSGIRPGVRAKCDDLFRIAMEPDAGSLNVSVAAGIIFAQLYGTTHS